LKVTQTTSGDSVMVSFTVVDVARRLRG